MSVNVKVLYFAAARERTGRGQEVVALPDGARVETLLQTLVERHAGLGPLLPHLRVAVNQELVPQESVLPDGAEVALIPPVAGGSGVDEPPDAAGAGGRFRVVETPLQVATVLALVESPRLGGTVTFLGKVRNATRGKAVVRLEYEAYAPMAEKVLSRIAQEVAERWPGTEVAIHHRVGVLTPGEAAVVIAAAAPHRKEAFAGCEHALERLKQDVPIWKKEVYADGEVWVGLGP